MNRIIICSLLVVLISLNYCASQQWPIISAFSNYDTIAEVTIDLNQNTMTAQKSAVPSDCTFESILEANSEYYTVLTQKETDTFVGYALGKYYFSNNTYVETSLFEEEGLNFFAYIEPIQYYDPVANAVSMCGINGQTITVTTYNLNTFDVEIYNTSIYIDDQGLPIGSIGPQPNQVTVFFVEGNSTTTASLLILDIDSAEEGILYNIENYFEVVPDFSYSYPVSVKGQTYLVAIKGDTLLKTVILLQVDLSSSSSPSSSSSSQSQSDGSNVSFSTATVKNIYQQENVYVGSMPAFVTNDQQNIIFIDSANVNTTSINFSVYNIQSAQTYSTNIVNNLEISLDYYFVYYSQ